MTDEKPGVDGQNFTKPVPAEDVSPVIPSVESDQPVVEAPLNLDEINQRYAVDQLCGPTSTDTIKGGLQGLQWVSILRNSPFNNSEWEMALGGYITSSLNKGAWKAIDLGESWQVAVETDMFREVDVVDGKKFIPTEKCLKFINDRLNHFTD